MKKLNKAEKDLLLILSKEKGPRVLNGLQRENVGKVSKLTMHSLVKKKLVRIRKGYYGRKNRYEIRALGRIQLNNK